MKTTSRSCRCEAAHRRCATSDETQPARCSAFNDWRSYAVVEGRARLHDATNTDAEQLRVLLREVYRVCGDNDHPDWDEYDVAMRRQDAVVVLVRPERIYGLLR